MSYMNMLISGEIAITSNNNKVSSSLKHLHQLTARLIGATENVENIGLFEGKAGMLLALHCAAKHFTNWPQLQQAIQQLQQEVCEQAATTDDTFSNGLFGIGWGIDFLYKRGFINENETDVLNSFDDELYKLVMYSKADSHSLESGTMGRIIYYLNRIPETLKLTNKYSYVCNYEILMLLVDDFTNANENIISGLQGNAAAGYLTKNNLGATLSRIFTVLSLLVNEGIHKEITEKQWLQLLKYFVAVYENEKPLETYRDTQLNRLFIYNNLLKCAMQSKTIAEKLSYDKLVVDTSFRPQSIQEAVLYKSYLKNIKHCFGKQPGEYNPDEKLINEDMGFGIEGLSGLVCLLAEEVDNTNDTLMEQLFLI
jgi:hypothetical protein